MNRKSFRGTLPNISHRLSSLPCECSPALGPEFPLQLEQSKFTRPFRTTKDFTVSAIYALSARLGLPLTSPNGRIDTYLQLLFCLLRLRQQRLGLKTPLHQTQIQANFDNVVFVLKSGDVPRIRSALYQRSLDRLVYRSRGLHCLEPS